MHLEFYIFLLRTKISLYGKLFNNINSLVSFAIGSLLIISSQGCTFCRRAKGHMYLFSLLVSPNVFFALLFFSSTFIIIIFFISGVSKFSCNLLLSIPYQITMAFINYSFDNADCQSSVKTILLAVSCMLMLMPWL